MRRAMMLCAAVLCLTMTLAPTALAAGADEVEVCYPTAITQSEDRRTIPRASPGLTLSRMVSTIL